MKSNHVSFTVFVKPLVDQSRGFSAKSNHEVIHVNHETNKTPGRSITIHSRSITHRAITKPTVPEGDGGPVASPKTDPNGRPQPCPK